MAGRNAVRTLASLVYSVDDDTLSRLRQRAEGVCSEKVRTGTYITSLAWVNWKHCADYLSEWVAANQEAPVPREFSENPRFAHNAATRKAIARLLADRWQDRHHIRPQHRIDTADGAE